MQCRFYNPFEDYKKKKYEGETKKKKQAMIGTTVCFCHNEWLTHSLFLPSFRENVVAQIIIIATTTTEARRVYYNDNRA